MIRAKHLIPVVLVLALAPVVVGEQAATALVGARAGMTGANAAAQWIPVPAWLAGTWQARSQTVTYCYDYRLGRNIITKPVTLTISRESTIGTQQDPSGQIWHWTGTPYQRRIETDSYVELQQIKKIEETQYQPSQVTTKSYALVTRSDKINGQVIDLFAEQTITTYDPVADGAIRTQFEVTDFDLSGSPIRVSQSYCDESRIKGFVQPPLPAP